MIKNIQTRFVVAAMLAVSLVTFSIFGVITFVSYVTIDNQLQSVIDLIINNDDKMPEYKQTPEEVTAFITQESQFTTRYFIITINSDGEVVDTNFDHIASITQDQAEEISENILGKKSNEGYYNNYKYKITEYGDNLKIVFLDRKYALK